jgi:hypothetical protein
MCSMRRTNKQFSPQPAVLLIAWWLQASRGDRMSWWLQVCWGGWMSRFLVSGQPRQNASVWKTASHTRLSKDEWVEGAHFGNW